MEKARIMIKRIREGQMMEKEDEVAREFLLRIPMKQKEDLDVTCTPTYLEEMILGRRYLEDDLTEEERQTEALSGTKKLEQVRLEDIFQIARDTFENPGTLFADTGCAHGCALVHEGKVCCFIEDIGRHNALDKVIGFALKNQISIADSFVFSSGRVSEDYLEKVIKAGFSMVVSRAAVTEAAVNLAREKEITLLGFIRKGNGNLYSDGKIKLV